MYTSTTVAVCPSDLSSQSCFLSHPQYSIKSWQSLVSSSIYYTLKVVSTFPPSRSHSSTRRPRTPSEDSVFESISQRGASTLPTKSRDYDPRVHQQHQPTHQLPSFIQSRRKTLSNYATRFRRPELRGCSLPARRSSSNPVPDASFLGTILALWVVRSLPPLDQT